MRYLRSFYCPDSEYSNKMERIDFATVTILCGNKKSKRSELLKFIYENIFSEYLSGAYEDNLWEKLAENKGQDIDDDDWAKWDESNDEFHKTVDLSWLHPFKENVNIYSAEKQPVNNVLHGEWYTYTSYKKSKWAKIFLEHIENFPTQFETDENGNPVLPMNVLIERNIGNLLNDDFCWYGAYEDYPSGELCLSECIKSNQSDFRDYDLCFLDMPEFGLSVDETIELVKCIEECAHLYSVQFVIATESPIIASITEALIYDMDDDIVKAKEWKDVRIVKKFYKFFDERLKG